MDKKIKPQAEQNPVGNNIYPGVDADRKLDNTVTNKEVCQRTRMQNNSRGQDFSQTNPDAQ